MYSALIHKTNYPELYNNVINDILTWFIQENIIRPINQQIDEKGVQHSALMNFITFDLHALITTQGFVHMQQLLQAKGTDQTVMIRLKDLVTTLYIKYGERDIDKLRKRTYKTMKRMYGLSFNVADIDTNGTLWLCPMFKHIYNTFQSNTYETPTRR